ncbi:nucleotide exchange factor GrpE [Candidatus Dependentiae bacterium]|nr:nucleotide exchange factor GrpE [Candidatus Dependentiae bacterium]
MENENKENLNTQQEEAENNKCCSELSELKNRYIYLNAEFDNYKRRIEKDRASWISNAQAQVILDFLTIIDDFDRALQTKLEQTSPENLSGLEMIRKSANQILKKYNVEEITDISHFDPVKHEAIMQVQSADHKPGDIVAVLQKGYTFKNQVLRPAKVSIAQ